MGYESKVYVIKDGYGSYGDVVAVFDLCKMGYDVYYGKSFPDLFDAPRIHDFYADDGNTLITKDRYGQEVRMASDNDEVIKWLEKSCKNDPYDREAVFLAFLKCMRKIGEDYCLYHYGY